MLMLTEEQKFSFDLKGYIVLPGVLEPDLVDRLKSPHRNTREGPGVAARA